MKTAECCRRIPNQSPRGPVSSRFFCSPLLHLTSSLPGLVGMLVEGNLNSGQQSWSRTYSLWCSLTSSISSTFEFRTLDPEGMVFYGDTEEGQDWFVLSLRDGIPEMQIGKANILVSVKGGPKLNDGSWHKVCSLKSIWFKEGNVLNCLL